jgi:peptidoglycan/xylan/chitin deacetylase (PgdA/CDA1 family)
VIGELPRIAAESDDACKMSGLSPAEKMQTAAITDRPLRSALRAVAARRPVILGYHGVHAPARNGHDPLHHWTHPDRFRRQVNLMGEAGFTFVTVAEIAERLRRREPVTGLAAVSFDDGMEDNHHTVLPMLRELGVPATFYIITGLIDRPNPWLAPESGARMMSEGALRELVAEGHEVGAHSVTHPDLARLRHADCLREMVESKQVLEGITGTSVRTFAYPSCRYSPVAKAAAREAGFIAAVTCEARGSWDPFELRRALITGVDGAAAFLLKVVDRYQPLFESPLGRAARACTRPVRVRMRRG